jgi:hypothetical protein
MEDAVGGEVLLAFVGATVAVPLGDEVPDVGPLGEAVPVTFIVGVNVSRLLPLGENVPFGEGDRVPLSTKVGGNVPGSLAVGNSLPWGSLVGALVGVSLGVKDPVTILGCNVTVC